MVAQPYRLVDTLPLLQSMGHHPNKGHSKIRVAGLDGQLKLRQAELHGQTPDAVSGRLGVAAGRLRQLRQHPLVTARRLDKEVTTQVLARTRRRRFVP